MNDHRSLASNDLTGVVEKIGGELIQRVGAMASGDGSLGMIGRIDPSSGNEDMSLKRSGDDRRCTDLIVGETRGYWFDADEDLYCSGDILSGNAIGLRHGFPRDWPDCYSSCKPLRKLVGKKGISGVRTGVVDIIDDKECYRLAPYLKKHGKECSFVTARRVQEGNGWDIVKGFIVYEIIEGTAGKSFVAHRHWWNMNPDTNTFIDLTLVNDLHCEMGGSKFKLLVESNRGSKEESLLQVENLYRYNDIIENYKSALRQKNEAEVKSTDKFIVRNQDKETLVDKPEKQYSSMNAKHSDQFENSTLNPSSTMSLLVMPPEAESMIEMLRTFEVEDVGSADWHRQRESLERLNLQAHHNVQSKSDEFVKSYLISLDKVTTIVHELLVMEVWREKVLPKLDKSCFESSIAHTNIYLALYHEAILVNLLESVLFYRETCEAMSEISLLEIVDYCLRRIQYLNSKTARDDAEYKDKDVKTLMSMSARDDLDERHAEIRLSMSFCSLSILRYLTEYMNELDLCVMARLLDTHDAIVQLVPLMEEKPWIRRRMFKGKYITEIHEKGSWREQDAADRQKVTSLDAQIWLSLNNLIVDHRARSKYEYDDFRKNTVIRLKRFFNEILFDQLPLLKDLQRVIDEIILMATPSAADIKQGRLILETVPEMRTALLKSQNWNTVASAQSKQQFGSGEEAERSTRERMKTMMESFDFMAALEQCQ